jgi:hypothetical protein
MYMVCRKVILIFYQCKTRPRAGNVQAAARIARAEVSQIGKAQHVSVCGTGTSLCSIACSLEDVAMLP